MSRDDAVREALRARIEWLKILGVSALATGPDRPAAPSTSPAPWTAPPAPPAAALRETAVSPSQAPAPRSQDGLFGSAERDHDDDEAAVAGGHAEETRRPVVSTPFALAAAVRDPAGQEGLLRIRDEIGDCRRCRLCERRTQVVFGVGDPGARLMFIGEGPGADEDAQGEPFVGRAGQLLTKMIEAMGLKRSQVYIANVVKCRPPENRTPLPDEVATCSPFLFRQIHAIGPRVIVCLGTPSAQAILGTRETITRLRGTFREVGGFRVMPTFHPAYLLRNPAAKREVWEDLKQVMGVLAE
ncbi:MAG TPA: uracil-DNA glycosylase [Candidatus Polarisedimenticolia bacterium]|jgi:DNA polymerase|nr:uracil-DNA glycosylase [Candidatus Polarisedimenticolia bacterium]